MRAVLGDREVVARMWVLRPQVLNRLKNSNSIFRPLHIDQAGTVLCQSYRLRTDHLLAGLEVPHGTSTVVLPVRKYAQHSVARGLLGSKLYDAVQKRHCPTAACAVFQFGRAFESGEIFRRDI